MFNASEVLEIAEQIERNGVLFYTAAKECFADEDVKELLNSFAEMERQHEVTFRRLRTTLAGPDPALDAFSEEHLAVRYLQAIANAHVFDPDSDPDALLGACAGELDVVDAALDAEKDSVVFYTGIRQLADQEEDKAAVQHIIEEEMDHITRLCELKSRLT